MSKIGYLPVGAFMLAGVVSLAAASTAQAVGKLGGAGGADHASAAPGCGDRCPVLATEGAPGNPGDKNGRSSAALSQGGGEFRVAGGASGAGDIRS
jgi:hypothetical protein